MIQLLLLQLDNAKWDSLLFLPKDVIHKVLRT